MFGSFAFSGVLNRRNLVFSENKDLSKGMASLTAVCLYLCVLDKTALWWGLEGNLLLP